MKIKTYEFNMKKIFPTELLEFLQCRHMARLRSLGVIPDSSASEEILMLREKGIEHEKNFLESLQGTVARIDSDASPAEQKQQTLQAMQEGADWIYQAYLEKGDCAGYADFLQKRNTPSDLGDFAFEVIDTKLSTRPSPANAIQLIHYSELLSKVQGKQNDTFHLVHGDNSKNTLYRHEIIDYYEEVLRDYKNFIHDKEFTEPFPIPACKQCGYKNHCESYLEKKKHLALIPGISLSEIQNLNKAGIKDIPDYLSFETFAVGIAENKFKDLKDSAESVIKNTISIKNKSSVSHLGNSLKDSLFFCLHRNIHTQQGTLTFFMGVMTEKGRYEAVFHHNAEQEKQSLLRIVNFITRYLAKFPHAKFIVNHTSDSRLLHDLSNLYNICHDEIDELMINKKIVILQNLLYQSFRFPVRDMNCQSLLEYIDSDFDPPPLLKKSPQLLYEIFSSFKLQESLEQIHELSRLELDMNINCTKKLSSLETNAFPLYLNQPTLNIGK